MKLVLTVLVSVLLSVSVFSQGAKTTTTAAKSNPHLKVFSLAVVTGDVYTAIAALNYYIAEQGSDNAYADTLAMLYMQQGSFGQCYYWADKRSKSKPDDNNLLEMRGICLEKMQQPKEAITVFENLYAKTKSPYHAYKLMELQYSIKRLQECIATANSAEQLQYKPEYIMNYTVGDQTGRTYLQAGVYNIHGLALYDLDKKAESKAYFAKAVALDSNFVLARQNLEALKTEENKGNKVNTPTQQTSPANKQ
jgi:tetratricopeptide (TPR) repeat protein